MIIEDLKLYITEEEIGLSLNDRYKLSVENALVTANVYENLDCDTFEVEFLKIDAVLMFENDEAKVSDVAGFFDVTKLVKDPIKEDMREKLIEHYLASK